MAWQRAALKGSLEALELLWSWAKEMELNTDELLLAQDKDGSTPFHLAAWNNDVKTLENMWVRAEETPLNPKELKNKLLLSKDSDGCMAWQIAALKCSLEALE